MRLKIFLYYGWLLLLTGFFQATSVIAGDYSSTLPAFAGSSFRPDGIPQGSSSGIEIPFKLINGRSLKILAFTGITVILVSKLDEPIDRQYALHPSNSLSHKALVRYGELGKLYDSRAPYYLLAGFSLAAAGLALASDHKAPLETAGLVLKSVLASTIFTTVLKITLGRARPYTQSGPHSFGFMDFGSNSSQWSSPSGHTASAFAMMTVLAKQVDRTWFSIAAYGFAGSVGLQRMLHRKHWASDVVLGGIIGYLTADTTVKRHNRKSKAPPSAQPYFAMNQWGIAFNF